MAKPLRRRTGPMPEDQVGMHARRQLQVAQQYMNRRSVRDDEEAFRRIQQSPDIDEIRVEVLKALGL